MSKELCNHLREIRKKVAAKNHIQYNPKKCTYAGDDCTGTCPQCDLEVRYLENELNRRKAMGLPVFTLEGDELRGLSPSGERLTLDAVSTEAAAEGPSALMGVLLFEL